MNLDFDAFADAPVADVDPLDFEPDMTAADIEYANETDALERSACTCPDVECVQHRDGFVDGYTIAWGF